MNICKKITILIMIFSVVSCKNESSDIVPQKQVDESRYKLPKNLSGEIECAIGDTLFQDTNFHIVQNSDSIYKIKYIRKDRYTLYRNGSLYFDSSMAIYQKFPDIYYHSDPKYKRIVSGVTNQAGGKEWYIKSTPEDFKTGYYYPYISFYNFVRSYTAFNNNTFVNISGPSIYLFHDYKRFGIIFIHYVDKDKIIISYRISIS